MNQQSPFPIFSIEGSSFERGQQYGSQCKTIIEECLRVYGKAFKYFTKLDWSAALPEAKKYIPFIEEYDPEIMEEIKGIAKGAGLSVEEIVALNARKEVMTALSPKVEAWVGCTTVAATPEATQSKHLLMGQDWDNFPALQKVNILLKIKQKNRPNIVTFVEAGQVGKLGFNSAGIALFANALYSDRWRTGVPFQVIMRGILNKGSMTDAIGAILQAKRASSINCLIAHAAGEIISIEYSPQDVNYIFPENGVIGHSNHFTVSNPKITDLGPALFPNTIFRSYRAKKFMTAKSGNIDIDTIKQILRDHFDKPQSLCRHVDKRLDEEAQTQTDASLILDLTEKRLDVALGPPCEHEYVTLNFKDFLQET